MSGLGYDTKSCLELLVHICILFSMVPPPLFFSYLDLRSCMINDMLSVGEICYWNVERELSLRARFLSFPNCDGRHALAIQYTSMVLDAADYCRCGSYCV